MKKNNDKDDWILLKDEVPVSDLIVLVYSSGKVFPAKHSHAKCLGFGMKHFFEIWGNQDNKCYVADVSHWMKMPSGPAEKPKEWKPD